MNNLPEFNSSFLFEVTKSFSKVRKSLNYDAYELKFNKVIDFVDGKKIEKIEVSIRSSASRNAKIVRLFIWADRWVWLDARKAKQKGWDWEYTIEGRLSGKASERDLMVALKTFYKESSVYDTNTVSELANSHWRKLIATGLKVVI